MSMHKWIGFCVVMAFVATSRSGRSEDGRPSQDTLKQMGLGELAFMPDAEAELVRGQGFKGGSWASASGSSFATMDSSFGDSHSENRYSAEGKHFAGGNNDSWAGKENTTTNCKPSHDNGGGWSRGNSGCDKQGCGGTGSCNSHPPGGGTTAGNCHSSGASIKVFAGGSSSARAR